VSAPVPIGYVVRPHGIRGDVLVASLTDHPGRFVPGARFSSDGVPQTVTIVEVRPHREGVLVRFAEIHDRTAAEGFVKITLAIPAAERRPLVEGEYWPEDLVGLTAVGPDGVTLGVVSDVVLGAAQDRLAVTTPSGVVVEIPFVAALVGEPEGGTISMQPPLGLFDELADADDEDSAQVEDDL